MHKPAAGRFHWKPIGALLFLLATGSSAAPDAAFPINSQVPPVARVARPYQFVFSSSTFTSSSTTLQYVLSNAPKWLQLDSTTRAFYGTPDTKDVGPAEFNLIATDATGSTSMPITLFVSADAGPGLGVPISQQLAALGTFSQPDDLLFYPSSPIMVSFRQDTFSNTNDETVYYAICTNNTPLPSWIAFDASRLQLSGITPDVTSPTELPQRFVILLMASDVVGFSAAVASFQIVVTSHELTFGEAAPNINASPGKPVNFTGLQKSLVLDQQPIRSYQLNGITADLPHWLSLDPQSLAISGTPPANAISQDCLVTANDSYGDTAQTTIFVSVSGSESLIKGGIGTIEAKIGSDFSYSFNQSLFVGPGLKINVSLGNMSHWLSFDSGTLLLSGQVPSDLYPQQDQLELIASKGTQNQTQNFMLSLVSGDVSIGSNSTSSATSDVAAPSAIATSGSPPQTGLNMISTTQVNGRIIALAVVLSVAISCLAVLFLWWLRRRLKRKARGSYLDAMRRQISRPYMQTLEEPFEKSTDDHARQNFSSNWPEIPRFNRMSFLASIPGAKRQSQSSEHRSKQQATEISRDDENPFCSTITSASVLPRLQGQQSLRRNTAKLPSCRLSGFGYGVTAEDFHSAQVYPRQTKHFSRSTSLRSMGHGKSRGSIDPPSTGSPTFSGARKPWPNQARSSAGSTACGTLEMFPTPPDNAIVRDDTPGRFSRSSRNRYPRDHVFFSGRDSSNHESRISNKMKYLLGPRLESYSEARPQSSGSNKENTISVLLEDDASGNEHDLDPAHDSESTVLRDASSSGQRKGMMMQGLIAPSLSRASSQALPLYHPLGQIHVRKRSFKHRAPPSPSPNPSTSRYSSSSGRLQVQRSKSSLTSSWRLGSANENEPLSDGGDGLLEGTDQEVGKARKHPHPLRSHESLGGEYRVEKLNLSRGKKTAGAGARGASNTRDGSGSAGEGSRIVLGQRSKRVSVVDEGLVRGREAGRSRRAEKAFV
ncbi:hypothetical protein MMC13_003972 [Lambiella insularis]|nr:hypothetical protein [Lambiella insularis]